MKLLIILISLICIFTLIYLIFKNNRKREEKIIDADFEEIDENNKKKWKKLYWHLFSDFLGFFLLFNN